MIKISHKDNRNRFFILKFGKLINPIAVISHLANLMKNNLSRTLEVRENLSLILFLLLHHLIYSNLVINYKYTKVYLFKVRK